jgi:peptidoglycan/LPS O-acetylase OafA/YrhL
MNLCASSSFSRLLYTLGASGVMQTQSENRICKFLGEISYPLYLVHYPLVYFYVAWVSNHKGVTIVQAWPYALLILTGGIAIGLCRIEMV